MRYSKWISGFLLAVRDRDYADARYCLRRLVRLVRLAVTSRA